jgi:hypothetical protein
MKYFAIAILAVAIGTLMPTGARAQIFFQGFETDTSGWFGDVTRVPSGSSDPNYASGINAASGNFFARLQENTPCTPDNTGCPGPFTFWGSPTFSGIPMPPSGSISELAIYLDVSFAATHSDSRFDWDSSLLAANGSFLQDFIFNVGANTVYSPSGPPPVCAPITGGYFVITASNNSQREGANAADPGRAPQCITTSGWYTFRHTFHPDNAGNLEVDFDILNSGGSVVASWNPSVPGSSASSPGYSFSTVGFNYYGWHSDEEISGLAIDNTLLRPLQPTKDDCKGGGWQNFPSPPGPFKNQGQCVSYFAAGKGN